MFTMYFSVHRGGPTLREPLEIDPLQRKKFSIRRAFPCIVALLLQSEANFSLSQLHLVRTS